jgi:carbonic anhydrase/acetyltransferase-like protein (isoleucine patch superfamily)
LGSSFEGIGLGLQGELAFTETMSAHRAVSAYKGVQPQIGADAFVAPSSSVIGNVTVGAGSSVWYGATLRGDVNSITLGSNSHIGDRTVVHVASEAGSVKGQALKTSIGDGVSIGPLSVIHACTVGNGATIGGSVKLLDGCVVEAGAIIEAGSLVSPGVTVPGGEVWGGVPAKHLRKATAEDVAAAAAQLEDSSSLSKVHEAECSKSHSQAYEEKIDAYEGQFKDPDYTADWKGEWRA